jgi:hypothetical protein
MALIKTKPKLEPTMKTKLSLLTAAIIAAIGSTATFAGNGPSFFPSATKPAASDRPAAMNCCVMNHAKSADKDATTSSGMSCHMGGHGDHAAMLGMAMEHKSCCK